MTTRNKKQETRNKKQETRNKKQETRNCYDMFSTCQGVGFRERNENCIYNFGKGLQRNGKLQGKCCNSVKCLGFMDRGTGKQKNIATVDLTVKNPKVKQIANCITAREDRGISRIAAIGNGVIVWEHT